MGEVRPAVGMFRKSAIRRSNGSGDANRYEIRGAETFLGNCGLTPRETHTRFQ